MSYVSDEDCVQVTAYLQLVALCVILLRDIYVTRSKQI